MRQLQKHSMVQAQKRLLDFTEKIRDEVYTFVFTDLEKAFGEQTVETLEAIDKGLQISLKAEDERWKIAIAKRYDGMVIIAHVSKLLSGDLSSEDSVFIRVIRDEVIDLVAQYVKDFLRLEHEAVQAWVNSLVSRPSLQPDRLVADARKRVKRIA